MWHVPGDIAKSVGRNFGSWLPRIHKPAVQNPDCLTKNVDPFYSDDTIVSISVIVFNAFFFPLHFLYIFFPFLLSGRSISNLDRLTIYFLRHRLDQCQPTTRHRNRTKKWLLVSVIRPSTTLHLFVSIHKRTVPAFSL